MAHAVTLPGERLAGMTADLMLKLKSGSHTLDEFDLFLQRKPLFVPEVSGNTLSPIVKAVKAVTASLLVLVGTVLVTATTEKFVAKDNFVVNIEADAKVKISYMGENFKTWFIDKVEEPIQDGVLRYQKLARKSVDGPIITELGGKAKAETTLTEMFSVMRLQGSGEDGALHTNGNLNIFYIRDQNSVLRTVYVYWFDGGWGVGASAVEDPRGWNDGRQVFSRNSVAV